MNLLNTVYTPRNTEIERPCFRAAPVFAATISSLLPRSSLHSFFRRNFIRIFATNQARACVYELQCIRSYETCWENESRRFNN